MRLFLVLLIGISLFSLNARAMTPISHVIEDSLEYTERDFVVTKQKSTVFTTPVQPQKPSAQSVLMYRNDNIKELPYENASYEKILMRIVQGKDGRSRILDTMQWPYTFHTQLSLHFSDGEYGGSGVLVGPHHILTAGHNVYSPITKDWVKKVVVRPGLNESSANFGEHSATKVYTFKEWIKDQNPSFDMALITLGHSIGLETGWAGLLVDNDETLKDEAIHVTGYPGDKGFNQLWTMSHKVKKFEPERIYYEIDTNKGQSGGPIWVNKYGPFLVGVHTHGETNLYEGNSGTRLSMNKLDKIAKWISETHDIKSKIPQQINIIDQINLLTTQMQKVTQENTTLSKKVNELQEQINPSRPLRAVFRNSHNNWLPFTTTGWIPVAFTLFEGNERLKGNLSTIEIPEDGLYSLYAHYFFQSDGKGGQSTPSMAIAINEPANIDNYFVALNLSPTRVQGDAAGLNRITRLNKGEKVMLSIKGTSTTEYFLGHFQFNIEKIH